MKPLCLEMEAFGSFADRQEIDFEALGDRRLFLIHGPTGAGKSTILEAICFALYGAPGGSGAASVAHLRSQHAEPGRLAKVTLDFMLGDMRYRVERTPRQMRPKLRGKGMKEEPGSATLYRFKQRNRGSDEPGEPIATKPSDVDARVKELLGLDRAQFRQVILLPQGEFRKLLEASSTDRQEILTKLFDIDRYADLESRLRNASDSLQKELGGLERDRATLLAQADAENDEAFELARKALGEELAAAEAALLEAEKACTRARGTLEKGRSDHERLRARDEARRRFEKLEARRPEFANDRTRMRDADRAEPVAAKIDHAAERARKKAEARARVEEARAARVQALADLEAAQNDEFAAREREPELRRLEEQRARLKSAREAVGALVSLRAKQAEESTRRSELLEELASAREAFEATRAAIAQAESALAEKASRETALQEKRAKRAHLENVKRFLEQEARHVARIGEIDAVREPLTKELEVARAVVTRTEEAIRDGQRVGDARIAARWSAALAEGEACPVCGSEAHPAPAHLAGEAEKEVLAESDFADLERLESELLAHRAGVEERAIQLSKLEGERETEERSLTTLRFEYERASEAAGAGGEAKDETALIESIARLQDEIEEGEAFIATAEQAESVLAIHRASLESDRGRIDQMARDEAGLEAALSERGRTIQARESELPAKADSIEALDELEAEVAQRHGSLSKRIEATRLETRRAESKRASAEAMVTERLAEAERTGGESAEADRAAQQALVAGGFETVAAVREARLGEEDRAALQQKLEAFEADLEAARLRAAETLAAAEGAEAADLESLASVLANAESRLETNRDRVGELRGRATSWDKLATALARQDAKAGELAKHYARIGALAKIASGDNPQRVSFQRFVLAAFLDEVLALATVSLRRMSKGRYELRRVTEVDDKRRRAGLDLAVWDAHTGQERPVVTLSGGESFCAALALALGLAEVVQRHSGGTRLDAIFVDEGFGSLDPESLELALETLVELQSGGRLVGLISHVPELKERVETRIEVQPGRGGSVLQFSLA